MISWNYFLVLAHHHYERVCSRGSGRKLLTESIPAASSNRSLSVQLPSSAAPSSSSSSSTVSTPVSRRQVAAKEAEDVSTDDVSWEPEVGSLADMKKYMDYHSVVQCRGGERPPGCPVDGIFPLRDKRVASIVGTVGDKSKEIAAMSVTIISIPTALIPEGSMTGDADAPKFDCNARLSHRMPEVNNQICAQRADESDLSVSNDLILSNSALLCICW